MPLKQRPAVLPIKERPAAVILTAEGILLVKDKNDKYLADSIAKIENDHTKTEWQKEAGKELVRPGKYSLPGGGTKPEDSNDPRNTIIREIDEELGLVIEKHAMLKLAEIVGKTRRHIIYLVRATGKIKLDPKESITGIGFLKEENCFPLTHTFFQNHVKHFHRNYYADDYRKERESGLARYLSQIQVSEKLIEKWYTEEKRAEYYRGKGQHPLPELITSSFNLEILDALHAPLSSPEPRSLTQSVKAIHIPPSPGRSVKPSILKVRDPALAIARPPLSGVQIKSKKKQSM
jgi:8-oxo-dGTP pyrophosphatase MutT (NUDIX family)